MDIDVRVNETDAMGIINNAKYFTYMEEGRFDLFNKLNVEYNENDAFVVAKATCEYIKPAQFGQTLNIDTQVKKIGDKSITLVTYIRDTETKDLIAKGEVIIVYYRVDLQQSERIPQVLQTQLKNFKNKGV